jgi:hypothetical protein
VQCTLQRVTNARERDTSGALARRQGSALERVFHTC